MALKVLRKDCAEDWIDWALEMMEAGFETEHLIMLAGLSSHTNRFEFDVTANNALRELALVGYTDDQVVYGYVYYLLDEGVNGRLSQRHVLGKVKEICMERDFDSELFDFYLLSYACEELDDLGYQNYWNDADESNIDVIVRKKFIEWINEYKGMYFK